jgi:hypothetical protein
MPMKTMTMTTILRMTKALCLFGIKLQTIGKVVPLGLT